MRKVLVTGSAGFIGYHLCDLLLREGFRVHGFDGMTDYYDVRLKQRRHQMLLQHPNFSATEAMLEDLAAFDAMADTFAPDIIVHLAAQAGVRYSLEAPRAYIEANVVGTFNVMEAARRHGVEHLLMASTSSVYGANTEMPYAETHKADTQLTIYAATKKATEAMGHSYAHLWNLPTTMFRFFTVYGPWGASPSWRALQGKAFGGEDGGGFGVFAGEHLLALAVGTALLNLSFLEFRASGASADIGANEWKLLC